MLPPSVGALQVWPRSSLCSTDVPKKKLLAPARIRVRPPRLSNASDGIEEPARSGPLGSKDCRPPQSRKRKAPLVVPTITSTVEPEFAVICDSLLPPLAAAPDTQRNTEQMF